MKRGTIEHPKTAMLAETLGVDLLTAVGLLEALFHFTAKYARQGDVGRFTNKHLACGVHWAGEPDELVAALVCCRWLDEDPAHRLVVHDWADHADGTVRKGIQRSGEEFIPPTGGMSGQCVETKCLHVVSGAPMPIQAHPSPSKAKAHERLDTDVLRTDGAPQPEMSGPPEGLGMGPNPCGPAASTPARDDLIKLLTDAGVDAPEAKLLVARATPKRICSVVRLARRKPELTNPAGYIRDLIVNRSRPHELTQLGEADSKIRSLARSVGA